MRKLRCLVPLVILGGFVAGCMHTQRPAGERGMEVGKTAPEIQGRDGDGLPVNLADLHGQVVLLDFWQSH